jgi:hypothetical protein
MVRTDLNNEKLERLQNSNTFCLPCNDLLLGPLEEDNGRMMFVDIADTTVPSLSYVLKHEMFTT